MHVYFFQGSSSAILVSTAARVAPTTQRSQENKKKGILTAMAFLLFMKEDMKRQPLSKQFYFRTVVTPIIFHNFCGSQYNFSAVEKVSAAASFSIFLKFSALFSPRPPATTICAIPGPGCSASWDLCFTYLDLPVESEIKNYKVMLTLEAFKVTHFNGFIIKQSIQLKLY